MNEINTHIHGMIHFDIIRLIKGGEGITFCDGKAFFIANVLPGETGTAEIFEEKPRFGRARVVERFTSSPDRRTDDSCPFANQCDGCGFRTPTHDSALRYKAQPIYDEIAKAAKIDLPPYELYPVPNDSKRQRIRLHWTNQGCGFFARLSHSIIAASACVAIDNHLRLCAKWLEENTTIAQHIKTPFHIDVQIDLDDDGNAYAAFKPIVQGDKSGTHRSGKRSNQATNKCSNQAANKRSQTEDATNRASANLSSSINSLIEEISQKAFDEKIFLGIVTPHATYGETMISSTTPAPSAFDAPSTFDAISTLSASELPCTTTFRRVGDFSQALPRANAIIHTLLAQFLDDAIRTATHPLTAADLFAGSGNLTFRIATKLPRVAAYELFCAPNAFQRGVEYNANAFCPNAHPTLDLFDLNAGLPEAAKTADIIVCDPARNGLSPQLTRDICHASARFIFYVSCEASSLARDLVTLKSQFTVEKIAFIDMFPETPHVETIAILKRI